MLLKQFGGVENFTVQSIPMPVPTDREVLIKVVAIGIDQIDLKTRKGSGMASQYEGKTPILLGWDVSGVITQVGKDVKEFSVGDEVFGTINFPGKGGSYAEFIAAPADQIALKPSIISHVEAAASTQSPLTAWQALVEKGGIKAGYKVLIHGATGGVGGFATQIAKHFGAYVVGTTSESGFALAKDFGVDEVIDYKKQRFEEITSGFDLILDTVGGENFVRSLKVLKPDGTIILLPSDKKDEAVKAAAENHVDKFYHILMHSSGEEMKKIASLFESGKMKVHVDKTFPFGQLPDAHEAMESGSVRGKVVVTV